MRVGTKNGERLTANPEIARELRWELGGARP